MVILGNIGLLIGLLLSFTFIGAICGIPIIFATVPLVIWGGVKMRQAAMDEVKDAIRSGIVEGRAGAASVNDRHEPRV